MNKMIYTKDLPPYTKECCGNCKRFFYVADGIPIYISTIIHNFNIGKVHFKIDIDIEKVKLELLPILLTSEIDE